MSKRRKIAVLGSNSFSGADFIDLLLGDERNEIIGVSRSPEKDDLFLPYKKRTKANFTFHQLDLNRDLSQICDLLDSFKPEWIVNFAAQSEVGPSWEHPEQWFQTNCVALAGLISHLRRQNYLRRYLHISSPEVYGACAGTVCEKAPLNPSTPYAASKAAADLLLFTYYKQFGFPLLMVRATNVYGAGQQLFKIIPRTVIYLKLGRTIELHGGGTAVKSYIHIRDVSRGELAVLENGEPGKIYHLSPDAGIAVRDVVKIICEMMGERFEDVTSTVDERPGQDAAYVIDSGRARADFGWSPQVGIKEGLSETIEWVDRNFKLIQNLPLEYIHKP